MTRIYVGGLSISTTEDGLRALFEEFGPVESVAVVTDRYSGQSRGFAFVEIASAETAQKAIEQLNGREVDGRYLIVNEARPRERRGPSFGGGGGGRGGEGGGRGGGGGGRDRW